MTAQADLFGPGRLRAEEIRMSPIDVPSRALTYWQPWASLHADGIKMVENRTWLPDPAILAPGGTYAVHAGLHHDRSVCGIPRIPPLYRSRLSVPFGAIIAVARLDSFHAGPESLPEDQRAWFAGRPWGWLSSEVFRLPDPIPCRGARRLWEIPSDVRGALSRAMAGCGP